MSSRYRAESCGSFLARALDSYLNVSTISRGGIGKAMNSAWSLDMYSQISQGMIFDKQIRLDSRVHVRLGSESVDLTLYLSNLVVYSSVGMIKNGLWTQTRILIDGLLPNHRHGIDSNPPDVDHPSWASVDCSSLKVSDVLISLGSSVRSVCVSKVVACHCSTTSRYKKWRCQV